MTSERSSNVDGFFPIIFKWGRFILINTLLAVVLSAGVALLLPNWYKATTSLLPPKQPDFLSSLSSTSSVLKGISGLSKIGGFGQKANAYNYFAILKSRSTMEKVIEKFDLLNVYDLADHSMEKTIKELSENVRFEDGEDENIVIDVYDKDPVRARDMCNYFVSVLNEMNTSIGTMEARTNREFIERRLNEARESLFWAEESLRIFQEKSGLIITPEQTSGVDAVASLYAMKVKKELELSILEKSVSSDNSALQQLKTEVDMLRKRVASLPETGISSLRHYRNLVIQQKIVEFLVPIYEQAKIEEQKNIPVLLVLDTAVTPEKKSKPQRSLIVLLSGLLVMAFSISLALLMNGLVKNQGASRNYLEGRLKSWVDFIIRQYKIPVNGY